MEQNNQVHSSEGIHRYSS